MLETVLYARAVDHLARLVEDILDLRIVASRHTRTVVNDSILHHHAVYPISLVSVCDIERTKRLEVKFLHDPHVPVLQVYESNIPHMRLVPEHPCLLEREEELADQGPRR